VPSNANEGLTSSLMGPFQKIKFRSFIMAVHAWEESDPKSHGKYMLPSHTMKEVYSSYGLDDNTCDFVGHALALHTDDSYKQRSCKETILKAQLYAESLARYGSSPYLYPLYGLGELPQGFARLSAIYGGTYMLHRPISNVEYGEDGKVTAICAPDPDDPEQKVKAVKTKMVIADPSYFPDKVRKIGRVARAIVIMNHPLPLTKGTAESGGSMSAQIIVPANQIMPAGSKKNDIYVGSVSQAHNVSAKGHWIAFVSTILESDSSDPEAELALGLQLCGAIEEKFVAVDDMMVPLEDGSKDNVFLSESYDATSHFETTFDDIASLYERCMGKPLDLTAAEADGVDGAGGEAQ